MSDGDDIGEFPELNVTTCSWVDNTEAPLSEKKYLVEDRDNFTTLFSDRHIMYIVVIVLCLLCYLPYVLRLQFVCGDLRRINASMNPFEWGGDDTEYVPLRRNPLSLSGDTNFEIGLVVCKTALVLTKVFFGNASVDYDQYIMGLGQFLVVLIGIAFVVLVIMYPPHFVEMRVQSEIFQASLLCVLWCYVLGFVTVILQPGCEEDMDDSIVTLVQFYIPLISSPIVFLIAVFLLGLVDKRDGAWEFFVRPFTTSCKSISAGSNSKVSPLA